MRVVRILGSRGPPLPWDVLGTSAPPNPFKSSPTVGKSTFKKSGDARPPRRKTGCPAPSRGNWQNLRGAAVGWFFCYESWSTRVQVPFCSQISASSQWSKICFGYQGIIFNGKKSPKIFTNAYGQAGGGWKFQNFQTTPPYSQSGWSLKDDGDCHDASHVYQRQSWCT